jgi:hypothetical protein
MHYAECESLSRRFPELRPDIAAVDDFIDSAAAQGNLCVTASYVTQRTGRDLHEVQAILSGLAQAGLLQVRYSVLCPDTTAFAAFFEDPAEIPASVFCEVCFSEHPVDLQEDVFVLFCKEGREDAPQPGRRGRSGTDKKKDVSGDVEEADRLAVLEENPLLKQYPSLSLHYNFIIVGDPPMSKNKASGPSVDTIALLYPIAILGISILGFWLLGPLGGALFLIFAMFGYPVVATFDPRDPLRGRQRIELFEKAVFHMPAIGGILSTAVHYSARLLSRK